MRKRYWLRAGLWIGIPLGIIVSIITLVDIDPPNYLGLPGLYSCQELTDWQGEEMMGCFFLVSPIINLIYGFIVGSIIGWLYGKIKNRKSSSVS